MPRSASTPRGSARKRTPSAKATNGTNGTPNGSASARRSKRSASSTRRTGSTKADSSSSDDDEVDRMAPYMDSKLKDAVYQVWRLAVILAYHYFYQWFYVHVNTVWFPGDTLTDFDKSVTATLLIHAASFWPPVLFMCAVDLLKAPHFIYKYKVQRKHNLTLKDHLQGMGGALANQVCCSIPFALLTFHAFQWRGNPTSVEEMPDFTDFLKSMLTSVFTWEIVFYYTHRLLHWGPFYKWIHKVHHSFKNPAAQASEYAHPVEFILGNVAPLMLGPLIARSHISFVWMWISYGIGDTLSSHSGYLFPWWPWGDTREHDYHHFSFKGNYGSIGLLDHLHGTYMEYSPKEMARA